MKKRIEKMTACVLALFALSAQAAWPEKPIKLVVGFAAGGPTDIVARAFADYASQLLGQPVIVENKAGANSILAAESVAAAPADGYTLYMGAINHSMTPALYAGRVKFDALKSFAPVCIMTVAPTVLVVGSGMNVKTLGAFMQVVKDESGKRSFGTSGVGSSGHFFSEMFLTSQNLKMNHIPYKGSAPTVTDLIGGQLDSSFATLGSVLQQIQAGRLTALAIAMPKRAAQLPNVPTFAEAGVRGYAADAWYGLLAPAGTPTAVLQLLEKASRQFTEIPATNTKFQAIGMQTNSVCGSAFAQQLEREIKTYTKLANDLNLKAE
jgi:tripartite-type tricarboxylate transporter receptor subunit TctC